MSQEPSPTFAAVVQPDWDQLEKIEECLRVAFFDRGVWRVEFMTSFVEPYRSRVVLGTSTDSERDALLDAPDLLGLVTGAIEASALDSSLIVGARSQSQETVDRDIAGSWFYALR